MRELFLTNSRSFTFSFMIKSQTYRPTSYLVAPLQYLSPRWRMFLPIAPDTSTAGHVTAERGGGGRWEEEKGGGWKEEETTEFLLSASQIS